MNTLRHSKAVTKLDKRVSNDTSRATSVIEPLALYQFCVDNPALLGNWQVEDVLSRSEDSSRLNTSFVERLNLTVRQGSAYL